MSLSFSIDFTIFGERFCGYTNFNWAKNNVSSEGVFHLSKAEWIQLRQMALSSNKEIKMIII